MTTPEPAHLLIVDDTPTNIEILLGILEQDYDLSFATSGRQALALATTEPHPDLILLDVMMPEMDGYEVCAALQAEPTTRQIPVIFITAKTDADSETRAFAAGGVDFIHKPVNRAVVRARVRLHLDLKRHARAMALSLAEIQRANDQLLVLSKAIEQSPTSIVITDANAIIQYVNPWFTQETGYTSAEAIGCNPRLLQSGLTTPSLYQEMWDHLPRGETWVGELVNRRKSGEVYWEEARIAPVKDAAGNITHYVAVKLNITDRKNAQDRLVYMATHDVLTQLPNRGLFFDRVTQSLELAKRRGGRAALLFIDLDKFKPINDTWGHAVGDLLLKAVAQRLTARIRAADTVGRIGGDEFVILLREVANEEGAIKVAEALRDALRQPFEVADKTLAISASIGIALSPDHGGDASELTRHADEAMYRAKEAGRDRLDLFAPHVLMGPS